MCCKFQLYKCMYGLKCYQLYHVLPVCRLFPIKNVYSSIFSPTTTWSPVKMHVWQVLVCDVIVWCKNRDAFIKKTKKNKKKTKKLHEKKKKKLHVLISFCFSGILIYFCFFRSKSGLQQYFWQIVKLIFLFVLDLL